MEMTLYFLSASTIPVLQLVLYYIHVLFKQLSACAPLPYLSKSAVIQTAKTMKGTKLNWMTKRPREAILGATEVE